MTPEQRKILEGHALSLETIRVDTSEAIRAALARLDELEATIAKILKAQEDERREAREAGVTYESVRSALADLASEEISFGKLVEIVRAASQVQSNVWKERFETFHEQYMRFSVAYDEKVAQVNALEATAVKYAFLLEEHHAAKKMLNDALDHSQQFQARIDELEAMQSRANDLMEEIFRQNTNPSGFDIGKVTIRADILRTALDALAPKDG